MPDRPVDKPLEEQLPQRICTDRPHRHPHLGDGATVLSQSCRDPSAPPSQQAHENPATELARQIPDGRAFDSGYRRCHQPIHLPSEIVAVIEWIDRGELGDARALPMSLRTTPPPDTSSRCDHLEVPLPLRQPSLDHPVHELDEPTVTVRAGCNQVTVRTVRHRFQRRDVLYLTQHIFYVRKVFPQLYVVLARLDQPGVAPGQQDHGRMQRSGLEDSRGYLSHADILVVFGHVRLKLLIREARHRSLQRFILLLDRAVEVEDIASTLRPEHRSARFDERVPAFAMDPALLRNLDVAANASLEAYRLHPPYLVLPEAELAMPCADVTTSIADHGRPPFERSRARLALQVLRHVPGQYRDELGVGEPLSRVHVAEGALGHTGEHDVEPELLDPLPQRFGPVVLVLHRHQLHSAIRPQSLSHVRVDVTRKAEPAAIVQPYGIELAQLDAEPGAVRPVDIRDVVPRVPAKAAHILRGGRNDGARDRVDHEQLLRGLSRGRFDPHAAGYSGRSVAGARESTRWSARALRGAWSRPRTRACAWPSRCCRSACPNGPTPAAVGSRAGPGCQSAR